MKATGTTCGVPSAPTVASRPSCRPPTRYASSLSRKTLIRADRSGCHYRAAMSTFDWGIGRYEHTATRLEPAARVVVEAAAPVAGERVVDVGCGTGNAALLAAERGAVVTGVDPAPRLLDVARAEAAARGLDVTFARGQAAEIPLEDGEADVMLSVFGVIFAP